MSKDEKDIRDEELETDQNYKEKVGEQTHEKDSKTNNESDKRPQEEVEYKYQEDKSDQDSKENQEEDKLKNAYVRLQADFANFKRRSEKEKQDIYKYGSEKLVTKLLSVADNLDRALAEAKDDTPLRQGIELVRKELMDILKAEGLEEIESDGIKFDPNQHHAVFMEDSDKHDSEHIIETFQKGYKLKEKVIRPAMVKVAK